MRSSIEWAQKLPTPQLLEKSITLADYLTTLSEAQIAKHMHVSATLAKKPKLTLQAWTHQPAYQTAAIDSFLGDIYSGFQAGTLTEANREYAHQHLRILSGLYGVLRALDGIYPYRLEVAYKLPKKPFNNLYSFWGQDIAKTMQNEELIVNLSSIEYSKAVLPYLPKAKVIAPKFMTIDSKTHQPRFVVVHAKIARGAFARWLIKNRIRDEASLMKFSDLNYRYDASLSTPKEPVFVTREFGGLGLSVRLT